MYHSENYWNQRYQEYDPYYIRNFYNQDHKKLPLKELIEAIEKFYYAKMVSKLESTLSKYGYTREDVGEILPEIDHHYEIIPFLKDCKELELYFFPPSKKEIFYLYSLQDKRDVVKAYLDSIKYVFDKDRVFDLIEGNYFIREKEGKIGVYFQLTEEGKRSFYYNENFFNSDLFPFRPYLTMDQFTKEDQEIVNRCTAIRGYRKYIDSK